MKGIRPNSSLAFDRLPDGSVVIARVQLVGQGNADDPKKEIVRFSHVMDPDIWAKVVAYVSKEGGGKDRDFKAFQFHMDHSG